MIVFNNYYISYIYINIISVKYKHHLGDFDLFILILLKF